MGGVKRPGECSADEAGRVESTTQGTSKRLRHTPPTSPCTSAQPAGACPICRGLLVQKCARAALARLHRPHRDRSPPRTLLAPPAHLPPPVSRLTPRTSRIPPPPFSLSAVLLSTTSATFPVLLPPPPSRPAPRLRPFSHRRSPASDRQPVRQHGDAGLAVHAQLRRLRLRVPRALPLTLAAQAQRLPHPREPVPQRVGIQYGAWRLRSRAPPQIVSSASGHRQAGLMAPPRVASGRPGCGERA